MPRFMLAIIIVAVAAFGAGYTGLNGDFVWDDVSLMVMKPVYRNFDIQKILFSPGNDVEYLPIRDISYIIDMKLWGVMRPYGFHLTNLILYCLNAITVFLVSHEILTSYAGASDRARQKPSDITVALLATLLFVVHPIHSEVVAFVTQRNTLLSSLFFFLSLWCYLRYVRERPAYGWYAISLVTFLLSLLSKGYSIILPLVLLLCVNTIAVHGRSRRRSILELVPFVAICALFLVIFTTIARSSNIMIFQPGNLSFSGKIAVALQIPIFYAEKLLFPVSLAPEYATFFADSLLSPRVLLCSVILVLTAIAAFKYQRTFPPLLLCYGWFLLTLLPALNLFPTHPVVADRYVFIPSFALCFLAASCLTVITRRRLFMLYLVVCTITISGLFFKIASQNKIWSSATILWSHAVKVEPMSFRAFINLSRALQDSGDLNGAIKAARRAVEIDPRSSEYDCLIGTQLLLIGNIPDAINAFSRSINRDTFFLEGYYQLAKSYERIGRFRDAADTYRRLLASPGLDLDGYRDKAINGLRELNGREADSVVQ